AIASEETNSTAHAATSGVEIQEGPLEDEGKFDIKGFIFHHIGDANEFAFWGHGESWKGLYLPIILWTDNGLVVFSAKEFQHDNEAQVVVEKNGDRFVRYHGKIFHASTGASLLQEETDEK